MCDEQRKRALCRASASTSAFRVHEKLNPHHGVGARPCCHQPGLRLRGSSSGPRWGVYQLWHQGPSYGTQWPARIGQLIALFSGPVEAALPLIVASTNSKAMV